MHVPKHHVFVNGRKLCSTVCEYPVAATVASPVVHLCTKCLDILRRRTVINKLPLPTSLKAAVEGK